MIIIRILLDFFFRLLPGYDRINYTRYLKTICWRNRRQLMFFIYGRKCNRCKAEKWLQIHHKTYKNRGYERFWELEVLCKYCHNLQHENEM